MNRNRAKQFSVDWFWAAAWLLAIRSADSWFHSHRLLSNSVAMQMALGSVFVAVFSSLRRRNPARKPRVIAENPVPLSAEVLRHIDSGRKIEAIKVYRQETGAGLRQSKDIVEQAAEARAGGVSVR